MASQRKTRCGRSTARLRCDRRVRSTSVPISFQQQLHSEELCMGQSAQGKEHDIAQGIPVAGTQPGVVSGVVFCSLRRTRLPMLFQQQVHSVSGVVKAHWEGTYQQREKRRGQVVIYFHYKEDTTPTQQCTTVFHAGAIP